MPCYEVNLIEVKFGGQSVALLRDIGARISADGKIATWRGVTVDLVKGIAKGEQSTINAMKREYSGAAIKRAAKKNGWTVTQRSEKEYIAIKY